MGKLLSLLLLVVVVVLLFKSSKRGTPRSSASSGAAASSNSPPPASAERMVQCARCGTFMPESDSALIDGAVSCRDPAHCAHRG